jgi:hypothetical protein
MGGIFSKFRRKRKSSITPINYSELENEILNFDYKAQYPLCSQKTVEKIKKNDREFYEFVNGSFKRWQERRVISMKEKKPHINFDQEEKYKILFYLS